MANKTSVDDKKYSVIESIAHNSNFNPFNHPMSFVYPARIALSGWIGHVPFGMYLIDVLRPKAIAELGTHHGVSYCAFCQAVKELGLETRCYAVDSWQGDAHTGFYGPEVLRDLEEYHTPLYGGFSQLIQSTFEEALGRFADDDLDLLHIDGFHTYEAVKQDFEKWLPKMTDRGVVLLHDIHVRESDFGVWKVWEELKPRFPHFEFVHSHGLGVLAVGKHYPDELNELLQCSTEEATRIRSFFAYLGQGLEAAQELIETKKTLHSHEEAIAFLSQDEKRKDRVIAKRDQAIAWLEAQADERENMINTRDDALAWLKAQADERETVIRARDEAITWLKAQAEERETVIRARDEAIAFLQNEISGARKVSR